MVQLEPLDFVTRPAGGPNEDWAGWVNDAAWVLDGASTRNSRSGSGDVRLGAESLVAALDRALRDLLGRPSPRDLSEVLRTAISLVTKADAATMADQPFKPSSAVAIVRANEGTLDYTILGDVYVVHRSKEGIRRITDPRAAERDAETGARLNELIHKLGSSDAARRTIWREIEERRKRDMNREGGYWIVSDAPDAANHASTGSFNVSRGDSILLCSDGFARLVEMLRIYPSWLALWNELDKRRPLASLVDELRAAEQDDNETIAYPRVKASDDATALLLTISAPNTRRSDKLDLNDLDLGGSVAP